MTTLLTWLRLPLFVLGIAILFLADRSYSAEDYHMGLRIAALTLCVLSLVMTFVLSVGAGGRRLPGEAKSWRYAAFWQLAFLIGIGLYFAYRKALGDSPVPDSAATKTMLAAWLIVVVLAGFAGVGIEWAIRETGKGETAEPQRIARAGLSMLAVGMLLAVLVTVNYTGDKKDITRDWSYLKVRTPTESSLKMVGTLAGDMKIALFYPSGNDVKTLIQDYFEALAKKQPTIKLEYFDKDMHPTKAEEHRVSRNGQIVFDMNGKKSRIDTGTNLAKARKTLKELDQEFQKAFLEITADRKTLYFTRGHGELSWVGDASENPFRSLRALEGFLRRQNYSTRLFGVAEGSSTAVPDDASAVVIAGPTEPFMPEEIQALKAYVDNGGNLMVFLDIQGPDGELVAVDDKGSPLMDMLGEMGLRYNRVPLGNEKNHVAMTRAESDVWFIFSNIYTSHDSVVNLARNDERVALLIYQGGYLSVTPELGRWKSFETIRTLSDTFADVNKNFKFDKDEKRDSYVIGAVSELKEKKAPAGDPKGKDVKNSRVVVLTDASAISDALVTNSQGNAFYFADSLKWLVGESETAGAIATEEDVKIRHTGKEDVVWFHGTVVVVPLLVLGAGFLATRRRKGGGKETKDAA